jgi:hypothetical protein
MRLVPITSASKPTVAINASPRAIRARITPSMTRPPRASPLPSGRIVQFRPSRRGKIGTGMRRCTDRLMMRPAHNRYIAKPAETPAPWRRGDETVLAQLHVRVIDRPGRRETARRCCCCHRASHRTAHSQASPAKMVNPDYLQSRVPYMAIHYQPPLIGRTDLELFDRLPTRRLPGS